MENNPKQKTTILKSHGAYILLFFILFAFLLCSIYFARHIERKVIPDEAVHLTISKHFSSTWRIPEETYAIYNNGVYINQRPFLYYWINAKVLNFLGLLNSQLDDWQILVALRLVNSFYSLLTLICTYFFAKEVIKHQWWALFPVYLLSNTLMFVALSGGINYDNLANLFSVMAIYFLVRTIQGKNYITNSLLWIIFAMLGTLSKITILPLAGVLFIIWIIYAIKNSKMIKLNPKSKIILILLILSASILFFINFSIYGINLIKYRSLQSPCTSFLSQEQCDLSPFKGRREKMALPEKLTFREVLIEGYPDPFRYLMDNWLPKMRHYVLGFFGHKIYTLPPLLMTAYRLMYIVIMIMIIRNFKRPKFLISSLFLIALFYILVLFHRNYYVALIYGFKFSGIQGRYIFPVITILYILMVYVISKIPNTATRWMITLYGIIVYLIGGPILFILYFSKLFNLQWLI